MNISDDMDMMDKIEAMMEQWFDDYIKSSFFDNLTDREKDNAGFIIKIFSEYMYNYLYESPEQWSSSSVEEVLSDVFPRKISADQETYEDVEPVLTTFFTFLSDSNKIKNANALTKAVKKACPKMLREANDSSNWGMAKSLMMGAFESGIDIDDKQAMDKFMMQYNANIMNKNLSAQPHSLLPTNTATKPKVGRNEFCPCGSGKKYKRCCGA